MMLVCCLSGFDVRWAAATGLARVISPSELDQRKQDASLLPKLLGWLAAARTAYAHVNISAWSQPESAPSGAYISPTIMPHTFSQCCATIREKAMRVNSTDNMLECAQTPVLIQFAADLFKHIHQAGMRELKPNMLSCVRLCELVASFYRGTTFFVELVSTWTPKPKQEETVSSAVHTLEQTPNMVLKEMVLRQTTRTLAQPATPFNRSSIASTEPAPGAIAVTVESVGSPPTGPTQRAVGSEASLSHPPMSLPPQPPPMPMAVHQLPHHALSRPIAQTAYQHGQPSQHMAMYYSQHQRMPLPPRHDQPQAQVKLEMPPSSWAAAHGSPMSGEEPIDGFSVLTDASAAMADLLVSGHHAPVGAEVAAPLPGGSSAGYPHHQPRRDRKRRRRQGGSSSSGGSLSRRKRRHANVPMSVRSAAAYRREEAKRLKKRSRQLQDEESAVPLPAQGSHVPGAAVSTVAAGRPRRASRKTTDPDFVSGQEYDLVTPGDDDDYGAQDDDYSMAGAGLPTGAPARRRR
jgi:hypothetical protein